MFALPRKIQKCTLWFYYPPRKNIAAIEFNSANIIGLSCVNLAEKITFAVVNKRRLSV